MTRHVLNDMTPQRSTGHELLRHTNKEQNITVHRTQGYKRFCVHYSLGSVLYPVSTGREPLLPVSDGGVQVFSGNDRTRSNATQGSLHVLLCTHSQTGSLCGNNVPESKYYPGYFKMTFMAYFQFRTRIQTQTQTQTRIPNPMAT